MARVVVVGGGIVGTMHALLAQRRGPDVLQLERDDLPASVADLPGAVAAWRQVRGKSERGRATSQVSGQ